MAKGDYYLPLYYKKLLASTIGWTDEEFGAYVRLLINQFDNETIPEDLKELKRIAPSIKKNWPLISKKFIKLDGGRLMNEVMNDVYQDAQSKKERNIKNGKKGGRPKKPTGLFLGSEMETQTKGIPIINNQQSITNSNTEPVFNPELLVPRMHQSFMALNPKAYLNQQEDFPVLREVAGKVHQWLKQEGDFLSPENSKIILDKWAELLNHAKADSHLSKYSLSQISRHFASIIQSFNNAGGTDLPVQQNRVPVKEMGTKEKLKALHGSTG